jgi:nickel transport protein
MKAGRLPRRFWVLGLLFLMAGEALAHRVNVFAWIEGGVVFVECRYPDGKKVNAGVIRVLDSAGTELLSGITNAQGEFSFRIPAQTDLTIVLEAGMGHRAEWTLSKEELAPIGQTSVAAPRDPSQQAPQAGTPGTVSTDTAPSAPPQAETIEQAIEKALDRKLAPVMKMLAESRDPGVRLSDVLGGIGYIIGLVGIAAYFKRKGSGL